MARRSVTFGIGFGIGIGFGTNVVFDSDSDSDSDPDVGSISSACSRNWFFPMDEPALQRRNPLLGSTPSPPDPLSGVVPTGTKMDRPSGKPALPGA